MKKPTYGIVNGSFAHKYSDGTTGKQYQCIVTSAQAVTCRPPIEPGKPCWYWSGVRPPRPTDKQGWEKHSGLHIQSLTETL